MRSTSADRAGSCAAPAWRTMSARSSLTACMTKWIGKCRSARTATPTIGIGCAWRKCGRARGSSSSVWIRCRKGRSWPMRRKSFRRPSSSVMRDMESLIHHFIIFTQGSSRRKPRPTARTEAPKGELGFFIVSDGSPRPYRSEDPRSVLHPHGRLRPHGARLFDLRHHHDFRHIRHRDGRM